MYLWPHTIHQILQSGILDWTLHMAYMAAVIFTWTTITNSGSLFSTCWWVCIVLATVLNHPFRSGSWLQPNCFQIAGLGHQHTWSGNSDMVHGNLPTCLNWAYCHWVVQWVYLQIHIMLLFLLFLNSIISKSCIKHSVFTIGMLCSLWYRLYWNPCFSLYILYFCK